MLSLFAPQSKTSVNVGGAAPQSTFSTQSQSSFGYGGLGAASTRTSKSSNFDSADLDLFSSSQFESMQKGAGMDRERSNRRDVPSDSSKQRKTNADELDSMLMDLGSKSSAAASDPGFSTDLQSFFPNQDPFQLQQQQQQQQRQSITQQNFVLKTEEENRIKAPPPSDLKAIIMQQKASGAWYKSDVGKLLGQLESVLISSMPKLETAANSDIEVLWVTAVVAAYLIKKYPNEANNWTQVVNKAYRYIAKQKKSLAIKPDLDWKLEAEKFVSLHLKI